MTIDSDKVVTATFSRKQYLVTVSASPVAAGSVSRGGTFSDGDLVTVTATAQSRLRLCQLDRRVESGGDKRHLRVYGNDDADADGELCRSQRRPIHADRDMDADRPLRRYADTNTDGDVYGDPDADLDTISNLYRYADTNTDGDGHGDVYGDPDADLDTISNLYRYADTNTDGDGHGDVYGDPDADLDTFSNLYGYADTNTDGDGHCHRNNYADAVRNSDAYSDTAANTGRSQRRGQRAGIQYVDIPLFTIDLDFA